MNIQRFWHAKSNLVGRHQVVGLYPCSTKTREIHPRRPKDFPRLQRYPEGEPEGNLEGQGKSGGRRGWISQYLPSFGGVQTFSHHQYFSRGGRYSFFLTLQCFNDVIFFQFLTMRCFADVLDKTST